MIDLNKMGGLVVTVKPGEYVQIGENIFVQVPVFKQGGHRQPQTRLRVIAPGLHISRRPRSTESLSEDAAND